MTDDPRPGLLLFAHGARDAAWARPFEAVAARCRAGGATVALGYLEFMAPDLAAAGAALVSAGCREVELLPLFLGAGGHVRKDIPRLLDELRAVHPQVRWTLRPAVGEAPALIEAMAAVALGGLAADREMIAGQATGHETPAGTAADAPGSPSA